jgi:hypothetical protein
MRPNDRSGTDQTGVQSGDQTPPEHPPKRALSIADAADQLGMTSEAVRMRLKRGTLPGEKVNGHWVVYLEATEQEPPSASITAQTPPERPTEQPTERVESADQTATIDVYRELVESQRGEITFLREQNEQLHRQMAAERERFDTIHSMALNRIEALSAGGIATEPPTASPAAPGAMEPITMAPDTLESDAPRRRWWARLFGGV